MRRLQGLVLAAAAWAAAPAHAGIVFTPHLSEYSRLPMGQYTEFTFIHTRIKDTYNRDGDKIPLGHPFVQPGERVDATLMLMKYLWIGNVFRDTGVPILNTRPQFCRLIGTVGHQQSTGEVVERGRLFGLTSGGSGLGDVFGLCGIYTHEHLWGPVKANGLFATTVKFPVGRFDQRALLNTGTNYWSVIPQFAFHAEIFGRLYVDGTVAYQFKGSNSRPAFGGLTPTDPADFRNAEINLAWKFSEHWFVDAGFSYRESVRPNRFEQVDVTFVDPVPPQEACDNTNNGLGIEIIDQSLCDSVSFFELEPQDRTYEDRGVRGKLLTAGFYYIYRTSSVLNLRVAYPMGGKGSQIDPVWDVHAAVPDPLNPGSFIRVPGPRISETSATVNGVQEAAAVSASPFFELRFVYLFWAP